MDAQELPETLTTCAGFVCRRRCALEVIDELLRLPRTQITGEETDLLLDLRWQLRQRTEAEAVLRGFCDLRRRMETRHYLAFFRLRRWLENHLLAVVRVCPAAEAQAVPVRLDHYCVEAIRRVCLCACLGTGSALLMPRLQFGFRPIPLQNGPRTPTVGGPLFRSAPVLSS